ncbi:MAG TPA: methyltransferase [Cytophagales bacterium]|jgi:2-polyprenyl-3-methyl-5-hydroxy-6-metoxy-1,4-benzoquinol methylase|nr:methyltransferase [Cytophagales bacterium]
MTNLTSCTLCGGKDFREFLKCKDHTSTQETFTIKTCTTCGFRFTDPQPSEAEIPKYYRSENYISHTGSKRNLFEIIYHISRRYSLIKKRNLISKNSSGRALLDYGCGTGEFLAEMKKKGWNISGIEPSDIAHTKAELKTEEKIHRTIFEIDKEKPFDVITLWHVLEHVHNPNEILTALGSYLNKTGTIIIAVPNCESYDAIHYNSFWAAYDVPRHLWHFSKENLKTILVKNGFKLTKILPMKLDSYYVSLLSESYKNKEGLKILNPIRAFVKGFISNLKGRKNMNYSSLIYIAKK